MATKYIRREFITLRQAEKFQNRLYNKYDIVRLISFPTMSEAGIYIFEVE